MTKPGGHQEWSVSAGGNVDFGRGIRGWTAGLAALALLAGAPDASAQASRREGRALEFKTDLPWADLQLEGDDEIHGVSPLRIPGPLEGDFWLSASGRGVETERGRVRVGLDEAGARVESWGAIPFRETFMRSLLFPGYPQARYNEDGKSRLLILGGLVGLGFTGWAQWELWQRDDDLTELEQRIAAATTESERDALTRERLDAQEEKSFAADRRLLFAGATGVVWGVSILDAIAFAPDFHVSAADEAGLSLALRRKTRLDAMLRSVVFPGLGQAYNGRSNKAVVAALAAGAAGTWLLHEQDDYNRAVADFRKVRGRFENASSVAERTALLSQQQALFEDVSDRESDRDLAMMLLAGVWGLSLLDAALDFDSGWGETPVSARVGIVPGSFGTVAAQLRF